MIEKQEKALDLAKRYIDRGQGIILSGGDVDTAVAYLNSAFDFIEMVQKTDDADCNVDIELMEEVEKGQSEGGV